MLEEANVKLSSAITDILGASGRRILKAMIAGETDPVRLSALGDRRLAASRAEDRIRRLGFTVDIRAAA